MSNRNFLDTPCPRCAWYGGTEGDNFWCNNPGCVNYRQFIKRKER
ncbi:hypothetical protein SAMN05216383_1392 [Prevotella sp. KH2C16]|nr:hypothetical protein SAMN05216383_1392 [Prevotella sp. KH2C16]